jgi:CP family cyanate transporter-like MFS transporter
MNVPNDIEPGMIVGNCRILRYDCPRASGAERKLSVSPSWGSQRSSVQLVSTYAMPSSTTTNASAAPSPARIITSLILLWLAGNALRLTLLAVPPVIPLIHDELHLNGTQIGVLTGLPPMLLAFAAVPGSLLIARLGLRAALAIGLALTAIGGALRGALPELSWLYAMTIATGAGVAILQVTMPSAVRAWTPHRIGFATAVYTNGLLIGEIIPVGLTLPLVLPLVGGHWQWAFVVWGALVAVIAVPVLALAPRPASGNGAAKRRWWPDWRKSLIWRLGLMLGTTNAVYFTTNAFIPDLMRGNGQSEWISAALTGLNVGQLPASLLLLAVAGRLEGKTWPYVVCGVFNVVAALGIVFGAGPWAVAAASLQGFANAAVLILVLALPPLLSPPDDVHRVTAAMFTISYSCAVITPIVSGVAWDLSGTASFAFLPIGVWGFVLIMLAPAINHVPRARS